MSIRMMKTLLAAAMMIGGYAPLALAEPAHNALNPAPREPLPQGRDPRYDPKAFHAANKKGKKPSRAQRKGR